MNEHPDIPTLNLSGTPTQIGEAHGEAAREKIRDHTDRFLELVLSRAATAPDEESLWSKWSPQVSANERFAPDLVEEMRARQQHPPQCHLRCILTVARPSNRTGARNDERVGGRGIGIMPRVHLSQRLNQATISCFISGV